MPTLNGKNCIITGGAGSIGLATAALFIAEGANVMLVDRDSERLAAAACTFPHDRIGTATADVSKAADVEAYVAAAVDRWGGIDVLFSNAGNDGAIRPITDYPDDLFDSIIATHVRGCFLACKHSIPQMNAGGSIIITSSITGIRGVAGTCAYTAAKHALIGIMRCVAREVAPQGIRVNTVNPGPVENGFMRAAEESMSGLLGRDAHSFFNEMIPMGRHATPEEVAQAVLFFASNQSSFTSGSMLMVDGAMCA